MNFMNKHLSNTALVTAIILPLISAIGWASQTLVTADELKESESRVMRFTEFNMIEIKLAINDESLIKYESINTLSTQAKRRYDSLVALNSRLTIRREQLTELNP